MKLVVVGQGYVGLPLAIRAAEVGIDVVGIDLDLHRTTALKQGKSFVEDIQDSQIQKYLTQGNYLPSSEYSDSENFDYAIITVPTPLRESLPDLTYIESATTSLASRLTPGCTVILESTTYPGTTQELVVPILERISGLIAGKDFFVGYSPERIDPGNKDWTFVNTPKVVSGIDKASLEKVDLIYSKLVEKTVPVSGPKEAELTKLLENTFRHVNIALVNELAIFGNQLGVNIWESIDAAATKPFGYMKFTPGPGVGGHCLPIDPSYLSWQVKRKLGHNFRFVELANDINEHMPDYILERSGMILNSQKLPFMDTKITIIGLSYKKNSGDVRESPSIRLIDLLRQRGAKVSGYDPHVSQRSWPAEIVRHENLSIAIKESELLILVTDHDDLDYKLLSESKTKILDTRNRISGNNVELL